MISPPENRSIDPYFDNKLVLAGRYGHDAILFDFNDLDFIKPVSISVPVFALYCE